MLTDFRERGREGERGIEASLSERNIARLPVCMLPLTRDLSHKHPSWGVNPQARTLTGCAHDLSVYRTTLWPSESHRPGQLSQYYRLYSLCCALHPCAYSVKVNWYFLIPSFSPQPHKPLLPCVHCSVIYSSQDTKATKVSIDRQGDEDVIHVYSGILLSNKKEWNLTIQGQLYRWKTETQKEKIPHYPEAEWGLN